MCNKYCNPEFDEHSEECIKSKSEISEEFAKDNNIPLQIIQNVKSRPNKSGSASKMPHNVINETE